LFTKKEKLVIILDRKEYLKNLNEREPVVVLGNIHDKNDKKTHDDLDNLDARYYTKVEGIERLTSMSKADQKAFLDKLVVKELRFVSRFLGISLKQQKHEIYNHIRASLDAKENCLLAYFSEDCIPKSTLCCNLEDFLIPNDSMESCFHSSICDSSDLLINFLHNNANRQSVTVYPGEGIFNLLVTLVDTGGSSGPPVSITVSTNRNVVLTGDKRYSNSSCMVMPDSHRKVYPGEKIPKKGVIVTFSFSNKEIIYKQINKNSYKNEPSSIAKNGTTSVPEEKTTTSKQAKPREGHEIVDSLKGKE
jgi:hypothetical protein